MATSAILDPSSSNNFFCEGVIECEAMLSLSSRSTSICPIILMEVTFLMFLMAQMIPARQKMTTMASTPEMLSGASQMLFYSE